MAVPVPVCSLNLPEKIRQLVLIVPEMMDGGHNISSKNWRARDGEDCEDWVWLTVTQHTEMYIYMRGQRSQRPQIS